MHPKTKKKNIADPVDATDPVDNAIDQKQKIYLVTGPSSGIGIEVIKSLTQNKNNIVRVLIRTHPKMSESWKKIPRGVIPYVVDITLKNDEDKKTLNEACKDVDVIVHLASIKQSTKVKYDEFVGVNVAGTENILEAWLNANKNNNELKFIYMSSTAVYGNKRRGEILNEESELKPSNSYGASKMMGEEVIKAFAVSNSRIKYTILRSATIYGPHYEEPFFKIFKLLVENKMRYIGSGNNHLILIHIKDLVNAINLAITSKNSNNKIYNVTDGNEYTQKYLIHKAAKYLNVEPPKKSINTTLAKLAASLFNMNKEELDFFISERIVDISKIKNELQFLPKEDLDLATKELVDKFFEQNRRYIKS
ncbi:MAG: NAD-dependent epimerase/dehydratase family protein [Candidatus Micrarchaeia archaeon]